MNDSIIDTVHANNMTEREAAALRQADQDIRSEHAGALSVHGPFRERFKPGWWAWNVQLTATNAEGARVCDGWLRVKREVRTDG